ncbi:MAG: type IV toxin-antitoxin system AbiEi family antitoxin [Bifidobacteriaceae bacterium]|jgi:hypothetical protein|nr:type IV toxin-antitoxin system AbiEi family antitoxin [Bifidobacteriaceae bacterium]
MTIPKALPRRLVGMVEAMELDQPRVVTLPELTKMAMEAGASADEAGAVKLVYRLRDLGWLGTVRTQGAWEFNPGSRAGPFGSGDPFIELRAHLAVAPAWTGCLAMESAATVLGLAQHLPSREVVALTPGERLPRAMSDWRTVTFGLPGAGRAVEDGLPLWNVEGLVAGIAIRPSGYRDLAGLAQWLPEAGERLRKDEFLECLAGRPDAVWQRATYLLRVAGAAAIAEVLLESRPPRHPVWFGATRTGGLYDPVAKVSDADLGRHLEGGVGA